MTDLSYLDRTAGLAAFNGVQPVTHFDVQNPLQKFMSLFTDSQSPGHIEQNNMLAAASPSPPDTTPQPPAPINPIAGFASAFIPGLRGSLERSHQGAIAQYVASIPHDKAVEYMASQDPAYMPALIAQKEADEKKKAIQNMAATMGMGGAPQPAAAPAGAVSPTPLQQFSATPDGFNPYAEIQVESGGGRNTVNPLNPHVHGPAQFDEATAKQVGLTDPNDMQQSIAATGRLAMQNRRVMLPILGREPTAPEIALAHQQGAGGASALINNPDENAVQALIHAGVHPAIALKSITQNGGTPDMTAGEFAKMHEDRYSKAAAAIDQGGGPGPLTQLANLSPAAGNSEPASTAPQRGQIAKFAQTYFDLAKQTGDPAYLEKGMALMTQQDTYKPETAQGKALSDRQHGYINDQQLGAMIGASTVDDSPLSGQELMDLLKEKEPNTASSVDQALRGVAMPSARSKDTQRVYALAGRVEPGFNPQVAAARNKNYQYFQPSGVGGQLLSSIKAIAGHAETAKKAFSGIGNTGSDYWNAAGNFVKSGYSNDTHTALNSYDEAINNLAPEIAKVVSGKTAVPEEEVSAQRKPFGHNLDPEAFNGAMNTAAEMVAKRAQIMLDNWQAAMNDGSKPPAAGLDKKTIDSFKSMGVDLSDYFDVTPATKTKSGGGGSPAPQGVDPDIWAHMTPEEQKLWQ